MAILAKDVMKLREVTGLGMMTCKKALTEADGNMEKAIDNLRKQGQATAAKRASKTAKEGKVFIVKSGSDAIVYEVNSETDFVARNDDFLSFANDLGVAILNEKPASIKEALALNVNAFGNISIQEKTMEIVGKIGEKINLTRFKVISIDSEKEQVFSYIHGDGKIGVLVTIASDKLDILSAEPVLVLGKDLAMQVAAANPEAISRTEMPEVEVAKEKEIYLEQVKKSGKPEKIWDIIVEGKLNKYYQQSVLTEQVFIKETSLTVAERIEQVAKEVGTPLSITSFTRFELGLYAPMEENK